MANKLAYGGYLASKTNIKQKISTQKFILNKFYAAQWRYSELKGGQRDVGWRGGGGGRGEEKNKMGGRDRKKGGKYMINCEFVVSCNDK